MMQNTNTAPERDPRSRQACDPCREKKIKCPAERPACSCCVRLGRTCRYSKRGPRPTAAATGQKLAKKRSSLRDRLHQLESQMHDIHGLLQPAPNNGPESSSQGPPLGPESAAQDETQQDLFDAVDDVDTPDQTPSSQPAFIRTSPDVSPETLADALDIYQRTIHLQPLPLFRPPELLSYLKSAPKFLLYSFLALTLSFDAQKRHSDTIETYARFAEDEVQKLASRGIPTLETVQSLCLLALRGILVCRPYQAQITIGFASRLEAWRFAANNASPQSTDADLSLRCYWSVYILEKAFSSRLCPSEEEIFGSVFPESAPVPQALPSYRHEEYPRDLYNSYNATTDLGIAAYYIRMVSNWGHVSLWLHHIRLAKAESPWLPESKYAKITARIYECDSQLPAKHLLRNVAFSKRSPSDVHQAREYWIPWVLMQIQCHAYLSILNHPFIHLVAIRYCSNGLQSGMFLQHTVDAALFHSAWVFRFLRLCDDHQLDLHDPFVGHLVAAVGTIPWLLQFVEDSQVSQKATADVAWCTMYLSRISQTWPHLSQKLQVFQSLELITKHYCQNSIPMSNSNVGESERGVTFPPGQLWQLLDPDLYHTNPQTPGPGQGQAPNARIQITTHLTHPLDKPSPGHTDGDTPAAFTNGLEVSGGEIEQVYIDDLLNHFMLYNGQEPLG